MLEFFRELFRDQNKFVQGASVLIGAAVGANLIQETLLAVGAPGNLALAIQVALGGLIGGAAIKAGKKATKKAR